MPNKVISRPSIGVTLTQTQLDALRQLHEAGVGTFVWLRLHRNTHLKFFNAGWVIMSAPPRSVTELRALKTQPPAHYALTAQGEAIYQAFCTGYRRRDGICPRCGERPRTPGNEYCRECENERARAYRAVPSGLCACGQPRKQSKTGRYYDECADCLRRKNRERYQAQHAARVDAQAAGTPITCCIPGCDNPCYISPSGRSSRTTCASCANVISRRSNRTYRRNRLIRHLQRHLGATV